MKQLVGDNMPPSTFAVAGFDALMLRLGICTVLAATTGSWGAWLTLAVFEAAWAFCAP